MNQRVAHNQMAPILAGGGGLEYVALLNNLIDELEAHVKILENRLAQGPFMPEPDWPTAPDWADWWVHDFGGFIWHEFKPWLQFDGTWHKAFKGSGKRIWPRTLFVVHDLPLGLDPRQSLRSRPGLPQEELG